MTLKYSAVLSNGGFELGNTNGWTVQYGNMIVRTTDTYPTYEGTWMSAVNTTQGVFYQDYTIPTSVGVGSGNIYAQVRAGQMDFQSDGDAGAIFMHVINSDGYIAAGWVGSVYTDLDSSWITNTGDMIPLPTNAAKIRIGFSGRRDAGTELSAYTDGWSLDFHTGSLYNYDVSPLNKDFSLLSSHWTVGTGTLAVGSNLVGFASSYNYVQPGIVNGAYFSSTAIGHLYQVVDIPNSGNLYKAIDAGSATFIGRYLQRSYSEADNGLVGVRFLDSSNTVLASIAHVASPFIAPAVGKVYTNSYVIPASTRKIQYDNWQVRSGGANIDAYVTGIEGSVVLPGYMYGGPLYEDNSLEFYNAFANMNTTSLFINVPYSLGLSSEYKWALGMMTGAITPGWTHAHWNITIGMNVHTTNYSDRYWYVSFHSEFGTVGGDRRELQGTSTNIGAILNDTANTIYRFEARSIYAGYISGRNSVDGFEFPRSYGLSMLFATGSFDVVRGSFFIDPSNVGSVYPGGLFPSGLTNPPQLLFITGASRNDELGVVEAYKSECIGWVDMRSLQHRFFNAYLFNGGGAGNFPCMLLSNSYMSWPTVSADLNFHNVAFHVCSTDTASIYIKVDSDNSALTAVNTWYYGFTAFDFLDPAINFRVDHFSLVGTSGVQSVQTNSLSPQLIMLQGINIKTPNYVAQIDGSAIDYISGNAYAFGVVHSGNIMSIEASMLSSFSIQNAYSFLSSNYLSMYDAPNGAARYVIRSFHTGSGGFDFYQSVTTNIDSWDGCLFQYCAIGVGVDAPPHFMGEDETSILLTNQEYGDDLLLSGAAVAVSSPDVASPYPLYNRDFWTDQYREYPVRVNSIRDFPVV